MRRIKLKNKSLAKARPRYNSACNAAKEDALKHCATFYIDWLNSEKHKAANKYHKHASLSTIQYCDETISYTIIGIIELMHKCLERHI